MSAKIAYTSALLMVLVSLAPVRAQVTAPAEAIPAPAGLNAAQPEPVPTPPQVLPGPGGLLPQADIYGIPQTDPATGQPIDSTAVPLPRPGLSDWITYNRINLWPVGNGRPMMYELFVRSGVAIPFASTIVGKNLNAGWEVGGGGRLMLFNAPATQAWFIEASMSTVENWRGSLGTAFPLTVLDGTTRINFGGPGPAGTTAIPNPTLAGGLQTVITTAKGVTIKSLNRTFVSLGPGKEWYIIGSATLPGWRWRIGVDGGGRWGSAKMELNEFHHRTDTIAALYAAAHTDVELPLSGACTFYLGVRAEWDYTWMDILQTTSDLQSINALATFGFRW